MNFTNFKALVGDSLANITNWTKFNYIGYLNTPSGIFVKKNPNANQLAPFYLDLNNWQNNGAIDFAVKNGYVQIKGLEGGLYGYIEFEQKANHTYYFAWEGYNDGVGGAVTTFSTTETLFNVPLTYKNTTYSVIKKTTETGVNRFEVRTDGLLINCFIKNIVIVDLTAMYGVGDEPTTAEEFLKDYPMYQAYVNYTPIKYKYVIKFNQGQKYEYDSVYKRIIITVNNLDIKPVRTVRIYSEGYVNLYNGEAFNEEWDNVIYNGANLREIYITNKKYTDVATFLAKEGNNLVYYN